MRLGAPIKVSSLAGLTDELAPWADSDALADDADAGPADAKAPRRRWRCQKAGWMIHKMMPARLPVQRQSIPGITRVFPNFTFCQPRGSVVGSFVFLSLVSMRTAYRDTLNNFANDIVELSDTVHQVMDLASQALLAQPETAQEPAAQAVAHTEDLNLIRERSEARALSCSPWKARLLRTPPGGFFDLYRGGFHTHGGSCHAHRHSGAAPFTGARGTGVSHPGFRAVSWSFVDDMAQQTNAILKDPAGGIDTAIK